MAHLYPSLISSDLLAIQKTITLLEPYCNGFHIDVMDGHFVSQLTWGPPFISAIRAATYQQLWVHLMVSNPENILPQIKVHTSDLVSIHYESCTPQTLKSLLKESASLCNAGIALKPHTPVSVIEPFINDLGHVLIMSVEPGKSGQPFIPATVQKIDALVALKKQHAARFDIALDGGITHETSAEVFAHGATHIAAASAIFASLDSQIVLKKCQALYESLRTNTD